MQKQAVADSDGREASVLKAKLRFTTEDKQMIQAADGTDASSQRAWIQVHNEFQAGLPLGVAMVANSWDPGSASFKKPVLCFKSYTEPEKGFANSTRPSVENKLFSFPDADVETYNVMEDVFSSGSGCTTWISVIQKDIPAPLYGGDGAYGFLFSFEYLWPHVVKGSMKVEGFELTTFGFQPSDFIDEEHPSKSKIYGKRGDRSDAKREFEADLQQMLTDLSEKYKEGYQLPLWDGNEMRVFGESLPADAFVGIVQCTRKVNENLKGAWKTDIEKNEKEKEWMISEFKRLTGRADAPFFEYDIALN